MQRKLGTQEEVDASAGFAQKGALFVRKGAGVQGRGGASLPFRIKGMPNCTKPERQQRLPAGSLCLPW